MIDIERRGKMAYHLRQLTVGLISNDEFEERVMNDVTYGYLPEQYYRAKEAENDDSVIRPILEFSWCLYNDTYNHKLNGKHKLSDNQIKEIARYILFLHSDFEYDWTYLDLTNPVIRFSFKDILKSIMTLGQHYKDLNLKREEEFELMKKSGDFEFWPFKTKADYERQLKKQPYLIGKNNANDEMARNKQNIMRKYSIVLLLLIFGLLGGLGSCNKTDSMENSLVGIWKSTKVDTLAQYIKPVKPETFRSYEYLNRVLVINVDGSFQLVESKDTITGTWNQSKSDSLIVTNNRIHGKYYYDSKIEFVDKNNLIICHSYGYGYSAIGSGYSVEESTLYDIKFHYTRK